MDTHELFARALPLVGPWTITDTRLDSKPARLHITIDLEGGTTRMDCPCCGAGGCAIHDRRGRRWRHMNFWQYETELVARVPRVRCERCGVHQVEVPWARPGSGFTLLFEAMALELVRSMSVSEAAGIMGVADRRIWTIIHHHVGEAYAGSDWSGVTRVVVDETSRKKGHVYVTNVIDLDTGRLLFMTPGKDAATLGEFASQLSGFKGDAGSIGEIAMDMSTAFQAGAAEHFPDSEVVFDKFHVMQLAGRAFDAVRRAVASEVGGLGRGAMWALRGNPGRLSEGRRELRERLLREHRKLARAMSLKEALQDMWRYADAGGAEEHFGWWYSWARRCRLPEFKRLAATLKRHWHGIASHFDNYTTSAVMEAANGKLQLARARAHGYRSFRNFRAIAYWIAGGLDVGHRLPKPLPQHF